MIPADRVVQLNHWLTALEPGTAGQAPQIRITLASFPGTLAFRLSLDEAQALAETLLTISKHYITEGAAGPLRISETDYHTPPRTRVLQLQPTTPFPGECAIFVTDIVARRLAADLVNAVQQAIANKAP
jgi:hypothetical protein